MDAPTGDVITSCPLCLENIVLSDLFSRHIARHMEDISFSVVTKSYEDWDFYDGSSGSSPCRELDVGD